nr:immunoglobulin heavy chain junction region [Mus musculus]
CSRSLLSAMDFW